MEAGSTTAAVGLTVQAFLASIMINTQPNKYNYIRGLIMFLPQRDNTERQGVKVLCGGLMCGVYCNNHNMVAEPGCNAINKQEHQTERRGRTDKRSSRAMINTET
jgi:hypothetical protein